MLILYGIGAVGNAKTINTNVPFTPQAPYAKWDKLHNEAWEEASIIMAQYWARNEYNSLDKKDADRLIKTLVQWQKENWGGNYDLSIAKTEELAKNIFDWKNTKRITRRKSCHRSIRRPQIKKSILFRKGAILSYARDSRF